MQKLIEQITGYCPISKAVERELENAFTLYKYKKNTIILKEEQICRHFRFIQKGLVRSYYYHDGKDRTYWFHPENKFFTSWYSFYLQKPSFEYFETLEDTEILAVNYDKYQELATKYPDFALFARRFVETECGRIDYFTKSYMDIPAKAKYRQLITDIPDIVSRVKLGYVASILGISQETLSRIRAGKI